MCGRQTSRDLSCVCQECLSAVQKGCGLHDQIVFLDCVRAQLGFTSAYLSSYSDYLKCLEVYSFYNGGGGFGSPISPVLMWLLINFDCY